jgi:hypothetical protein
MGFSSQSGYFALRQYAGGATAPADLATKGRVYRRRSGSLAANRELMIPDAEIGGTRDIPDAYLGAVSYSGDLEMYLRLKEFGSLLYGAMGADAITGTLATGGFKHTITPVDTNLPGFYLEERVGNTFETFQYEDAVINTLHLEAEANGYAAATAGVLAKKQKVTAATAGLSVLTDDSPLIVGTNITVTYNAVTLPAKSFSMDLNNNVEDDDYRLGSFYIGDETAKRRELTFGLTLRPADSTIFRQAVYGSSTATEAGGIVTKNQLVITLMSYEDIPGVTGPTAKYTLALTVPKAAFTPFGLEPSGDDVIEHDVEIQALRPAVATPIMTGVVTTDAATLA